MDSDGYSPSDKAKDIASSFHNSNLNLIHGVAELVSSLGGKPRIRQTMSAGRKGGIIDGKQIIAKRDMWSVSFVLEQPVHRLARKLDRQKTPESQRSRLHYIKYIRRVENQDTQCIEVDSPSHLFLAGKSMIPTCNSIFRNAVSDYFYYKRICEIEAIGIERDMTGMIVMEVPIKLLRADAPAADKALLADLQKMCGELKRDEREYAIVPSKLNPDGSPTGYDLKLLSSGGRRQIDTDVIKRSYKVNMLQSVLAQFLELGMASTGSFALASTQTDLFAVALGSFLDSIAATFNRDAIGKLMQYNQVDAALWPELVHGDLESPALAEMGAYVQALAGSGQLPQDEAIQRKLLEIAKLPMPAKPEDEVSKKRQTKLKLQRAS